MLLLLRAHLPGPRRHVRAQRLQGTAGGAGTGTRSRPGPGVRRLRPIPAAAPCFPGGPRAPRCRQVCDQRADVTRLSQQDAHSRSGFVSV